MKTLKIDDDECVLEFGGYRVVYLRDDIDHSVMGVYDAEANQLHQGEPWGADVWQMYHALLAHEEAAADTRRLTRELDVAMHGEAGAAEQASLCDLIPAAKALRAKSLEALKVLNAQGMFAKPSEYGPDEQFMLDGFSMCVSFEDAQTAVRKARDILSEAV